MKTHPTRRTRSSLIVCTLISALALWSCGAEQQGESTSSDSAPVASEHQHASPGETCFICDETQREAGRLWCTEHARYEDRCWECQPQLEDKGRMYCEEHSLYEDECTLCHPEAATPPSDDEKHSDAHHGTGEGGELFCKEHRVPEDECGICQPQLVSQLVPGGELKVRFESTEAASKAGVLTVLAQAETSQASVPAICETSYNQNALAHITPLASGVIAAVHADVGTEVERGALLVELHSSEVASAKASYVTAAVDASLKLSSLEREERLAEKNISSEKELQEADAAYKTAELAQATAKQRLLNFGFTEAEVEGIFKDRDTSALLPIRAPFDGTLVNRSAVTGEAAAPGTSLFTLADLSTVWLRLSIDADQAQLVHSGAVVQVAFSGLEPSVLAGELTWLDSAIDERTRMLHGRAVLDNPTRSLRAGMFGTARILVGRSTDSVSVPRDSIQSFQDQPHVFVRLEDDLYSLRRVATADGAASGRVAVVEGLGVNESVVSTGAFTVMSEFLKSRLGAGCVDD